MFGAKELISIFNIIRANDMIGKKIYFSNLFYNDSKGNKHEILWIEAPKGSTVYSELQVCIDDVENKLFGNRIATTMIYLEIQKLNREFNGN
jgi:hypothetical protein